MHVGFDGRLITKWEKLSSWKPDVIYQGDGGESLNETPYTTFYSSNCFLWVVFFKKFTVLKSLEFKPHSKITFRKRKKKSYKNTYTIPSVFDIDCAHCIMCSFVAA